MRLPMLIRTSEEYQKAAAIMTPYLEKAFAKRRARARTISVPVSDRFLEQEADCAYRYQGTEIGVTSPEQGEFIKRLGGIPVTLGAPEVPSALDRGVVDGVPTANTGGGNVWKDLLKFNYRVGVNYFNSVIIVNKERFEKLTPDVQAKVRKIVNDKNMPSLLPRQWRMRKRFSRRSSPMVA